MAVKKNTRNKKQEKSLPWGAMFLSFAIGAFAMFLLHLKDNVPVDKATKKVVEKEQNKPTRVEPTFDFYTLLPEMEVVVDTPQKSTTPIVTSPHTTTADSHDKVSYMLQVGSFRKASDADSYRARLALLGIESKVQTVTIDNKDTWHRVQVGPIIGRDKADKLQKQLKQNKIESLLMKAKHG